MADPMKNAAAAAQHTRHIVGPTIQLGSGLYFDYVMPDASAMTIEDYAWGIASSARFAGQTRSRDQNGRRVFYYVAQHCVLLALAMYEDNHPIEAVYQGLMHESDEAVWPDITGPAKSLLPPGVKEVIKRSGDAIDVRFGVGREYKNLVKQYDIRMLATEKRDLMPQGGDDYWPIIQGYEPFPWKIDPCSAEEAVYRFLCTFEHLRQRLGMPSEVRQPAHGVWR